MPQRRGVDDGICRVRSNCEPLAASRLHEQHPKPRFIYPSSTNALPYKGPIMYRKKLFLTLGQEENKMVQRLDFARESPEIMSKFMAFVSGVEENAVEESSRDLVNVRIAQLNSCTYCLDLHIKQAKIHGERDLRLHHLASWRESTLFSPRERAVLEWTEVLTKLPELGVSDDIYEYVRTHLSDKEISDLTFVVISANAWTRLHAGFKTVPGSSDVILGLDKAGLK